MSDYQAPVADILFTLRTVAGLEALRALPGYADANAETVEAILDAAGKLSGEVLAPLNAIGDREGSHLENGVVTTPPGFKDAYRQFAEGGWNAIAFDPEYGGQGMPWVLTSALQEMWNSANMAFALCPLLTQGAIEALQLHGTAEQKSTYLRKMIDGTWSGTMNLTEPQAGSDLGAIRTMATPGGDGTYRVKGQKIFITYGEHDFTENIVHFVLARLPDAPRARRASRSSSFRNSSPNPTARPAGATISVASRWSTSSASTPRRPASWPMATTRVPSVSSSASPIAASNTCSP